MTDPNPDLPCKRVAFLVTDGFEQSELLEPMKAVKQTGAEAVVITPDGEQARGWRHGEWVDPVDADVALTDAQPEHYDGLVLPGGVLNPDTLRTNEKAVGFVKRFFATGRPVAAICHGPWTLVEADVVRDRKLTSWPSLKTDLQNAGATWVDEEVVVDQGLVTSRNPDDLPAFCSKLVEELGEGTHHRRVTA